MFCGRPDLNAEVAWPKWLRKVLPQQDDWPFVGGTTHPFTDEVKVEREWLKRKLEVRVREFCKNECNGGWMSRLESAAIPILTPMIQGQRQFLGRPDDRPLARGSRDPGSKWLGGGRGLRTALGRQEWG